MLWERLPAGAKRLLPAGRSPRAVIVAGCFVAGLGAYGLLHVTAGHQQRRFPADRAIVEDIWRSLPAALDSHELNGRPLLVDMDQRAWGVAAGLVLQLYQAGVTVRVPEEWVFLFGDPLASATDEHLALTIADAGGQDDRAADPAYHLVAERSHVRVYLRKTGSGGEQAP